MTDPIAEGVKLVPKLRREFEENKNDWPLHKCERQITIIAALTAAGEMAGERPGMVMVPVEPTEAMIEAARMTLPGHFDICDADIEDIYVTMLASAAPASPVGEDVEKVAKAIWNVDAHPARKNWDEAIQSDDYSEALNDCRAYARAAIAAIGRT